MVLIMPLLNFENKVFPETVVSCFKAALLLLEYKEMIYMTGNQSQNSSTGVPLFQSLKQPPLELFCHI